MDTKFLRELIEKNTRVILPEFGAFLVKDDGTGVFKPENLTFSPFLRYNDGVVEDALAIELKISKDQAKTQINKFIEELKSVLVEKKSFSIEGLGNLYVDNRGSIHFTAGEPKINESQTTRKEIIDIKPPRTKISKPPVSKSKLSDDADKMKSSSEPQPPTIETKKEVELEKVDEKEEEKEKEKEKEIVNEKDSETPKLQPKVPEEPKETIKKPTEIPVAKVKPPQKSPIASERPKKKSSGGTGKSILMGTLIGLGFVVIVAGGWYLYDTGFFNSGQGIPESLKVSQADDSKETSERTDETDKASADRKGKFEAEFEKLSSEIDKSSTDTDPSKTAKTTEKKLVKPKPTGDEKLAVSYPQDGMFHIIAGSFRNASYAEKFSEDMKASGFKSKVIVQPSGMYSVTLGSFLSRQEAVDSMNQWKQQYPNIWILKQ